MAAPAGPLDLDRELNRKIPGLTDSTPIAEREVDTSGPPPAPPTLNLDLTAVDADPTGAVAPTFDKAFGVPEEGILPTPVGPDPGEISRESLFNIGGPGALQDTQRPSLGIGTALEVTSMILGKTSGSQRADPIHLNLLQRVMLGVSDIMAIKDGRQMPSTSLKQFMTSAARLEMQNNRQALVTGLAAMKGLGEQISKLPRDQRAAAMATQIPVLEGLSPGLGALGLVLADNPNEADAMASFFANPNNFKGTAATQVMNYITAMAFVAPERAGRVWEQAIGKEGVFQASVNHLAPSMIKSLLPDQIAAGRRVGGAAEAFANRLAAGTEITPEEYVVWHEGLPESVKADDSFIESFVSNPARMLAVMGGLKTAEMVAAQQKLEAEGEFSTPVAMVNKNDPNDWVGGPSESARIRNLGPEYIPMSVNHDAMFGTNGDGVGGPFGPPSKATITDIQKDLRDMRTAADELVGIQEGFTKDLQTIPSAMINTYSGLKENLGIELTEEQQAFRRRFVGNRTRTLASLSAKLNRHSGAAVSPQEFERISATQPADSDDPGEFQIKLDTSIALVMFSVARMHAWEMTGATQTMSTAYRMRRDDVRNAIRGKASELLNRYHNEFPNLEETDILNAVQEDVAEAFGVRVRDLHGILNGGDDVTFSGGG